MMCRAGALLIIAAIALSVTAAADAQSLTDSAVVSALRRGGYVILIRHASSPNQPPDAATANPDNVNRERQLDLTGRATATGMGEGFRRLGIPVGEVLTSPTYRAQETARLAGWTSPRTVAALGDRGQSMAAITEQDAVTLRSLVSSRVPASTNRVIITHMPNIAKAFPDIHDVTDGEALVFEPNGGEMPKLIGRIKIEDWPRLR